MTTLSILSATDCLGIAPSEVGYQLCGEVPCEHYGAFILPQCRRYTPHVSLSCPVRYQGQTCQCQCHGLVWDGPWVDPELTNLPFAARAAMVVRASDRQRLADMVGTLYPRRSKEHHAFARLRSVLDRDPTRAEWEGLLERPYTASTTMED